MDFIIENSADPYEMTHHVAFHLGVPCSIKCPLRGFWYTKNIQRLSISYIRVQKFPCFTTDQIRYRFYCGRLSPFLGLEKIPTVSLSAKGHAPGCHVFEGPSLFYLFCSGSPGNITVKFYSIPGGMLKVSYKCLQGKPATPRIIF